MIIEREENTQKLAELWLRSCTRAHHFVEPSFWENLFGEVRDVYLPSVVTYSIRQSQDGPIMGFVSMKNDHIEALFVEPSEQEKGFGSRLIDFVKSRHTCLTLNVFVDNERTVKFYRDHGFVEKCRRNDPNTGHPELVMEYEPREGKQDREQTKRGPQVRTS